MTQTLDLQPGLYFTIAPDAPEPGCALPPALSRHIAYLALGMGLHPVSSEPCIVLSNDRDELCTVPSRLLRTYRLIPSACCLRMVLFPAHAPELDPQPRVSPALHAEPAHA